MKYVVRDNDTLESIYYECLAANSRGERLECNFLGEDIDSASINIEDISNKLYGVSYSDYINNKRKEEYLKKKELERLEEKNEIVKLTEECKQYIYPQRIKAWEEYSAKLGSGLYGLLAVRAVFDIIRCLDENQDMNSVLNYVNDLGLSGAGYSIIRQGAFLFSPNGPEFYESSALEPLSIEEKKAVLNMKRKNLLLKRANEATLASNNDTRDSGRQL